MKEIELFQFNTVTELSQYLDHLFGSSFQPTFFDDNTYMEAFIQDLKQKDIQIFEGEYFVPIDDNDDLTLSPRRKLLLERFQGKGSNITPVRRALLMLLDPSLTDLDLYSKSVIIDSKHNSCFFTGIFTLSKFVNFICHGPADNIDKIYIFPYHKGISHRESPFEQETYVKILIDDRVKQHFQKIETYYLEQILSHII